MSELKVKDAFVILSKSGLPVEVVKELNVTFGPYKEILKEHRETALSIVVTSKDQVKEMEAGRKLRLFLRKHRIEADNDRKTKKEYTNLYNKTVQSLSNEVIDDFKEVEAHLQKQEDFLKNLEAEIEAKRVEKLAKTIDRYKEFVPSFVHISSLTDEEFIKVYDDAKREFLENEELKKQEALKAEEAEKTRKAESKRLAELEANDRARLAKEREARILQEQEEAAATKLKADEDAKARSLAMGPDKDKLKAFAVGLEEYVSDNIPEFTDPESIKILEDIKGLIGKTVNYIHAKADKL
jgi:hypothetical protein